MGLKSALAVTLLVVGFNVQAEPYFGVSLGHSSQKVNNQRPCLGDCSIKRDTTISVANAFAGYRWGNVAAEVGGGELGAFRCAAKSGFVNITQDIETSHFYGRGLYFHRLSKNAELFGSLGVSRVSFTNHEYGTNDPSLAFVENSNKGTNYRLMYGVGGLYKFDSKTSLRMEVTRLNNVAVSPWTLKSDVTTAWIGAQVSF